MSEYKRAYISEIGKYEGQDICIKGWLYNKRSSGKLHFLQVRDGTGIIQAVIFKGDVDPEVFEKADKISQESSIIVCGTVKEDKRSQIGYEIGVKDVQIIGESVEYPITPKEHGVAFLLDKRHLWLRSPRQHAILKIRHEIIKSIRDYFNNNNFLLVDAPIFTPAACEGTTNLFETEYFDEKAYLTQSGQLYMEAAAMAFGKVYCFGPTFRAEKSKTRRHLTEFWMVEPEVAYNDLNDNMDLAEDFVEYVVQQVVKNRRAELEILERDISKLENIKKPFPRITYDEAIELLNKNGKEAPWGDDFGGDEETVISEQFDRPVMIHRYPAEVKAFYMKQDPENSKLALCVDMIAPEGYGEIIGGGQREDDMDVLLEKIREHKLPEEAFEWYLDLRRYGTVPHAGFGLGIERTVSWICGLHHVRETIPFPRMMERIRP
ncbi:MAG: asparagine--tRNA ligase [Candidatus Melainabacteria bacterium RIFOXYA12_FULL_32_12]|nr:MAG: asparagine--tRNA ligase [Candidatus Melainabacteria bacterium GWF2_32_7]OGI21665.1 MAG: asparagine--tRNA ligase [Candidatus Melainabacteria bacterium RIFOXYA2_FULL_32_9]OGI31042.1 MAG: asparagine--tRNA ligase [Candidatus Melainabacteria bacterium RIFOXYA12_FULL_32_12]